MIAPSRPSLTVATPSDTEIVLTRTFEAPRRIVWDAWTRPEHVSRWLLGLPGWTGPVCEMDLRPGGEQRFVWRQGDEAEMEIRATYREILPPERLVTTESWGPEWPETVNTLELAEENGWTTMTLTIRYPSKEARDAALQTGMTEGFGANLDRLAELLPDLG